jgi:hypothetical protein
MIAVLCMTAPAFAGDITFTASSSAAGQFTIGYVATDPCDVPVGIGIKVTLTGSCDAYVEGEASVVSSSPDFDVHIDYASEDPCNYTIGMGGQVPIADPCGAGLPDPCADVISICMGRLDPCNLADPCVPNLVTISVGCSASAGAGCTVGVDIEADGLRGGIVGADFGTVFMVDGSLVCEAAATLPPCWTTATQCDGDFGPLPLGDGTANSTDFLALKASYLKDYCNHWNGGAGPYHPCADANHDGFVNSTDFLALKAYYLDVPTPPPGTCPGTGVWPPVCE